MTKLWKLVWVNDEGEQFTGVIMCNTVEYALQKLKENYDAEPNQVLYITELGPRELWIP